MTLLLKNEDKIQYHLGVWQYEENLDELSLKVSLSKAEKEMYLSLGCDKRKKEFLATRLLLSRFIDQPVSLEYHINGKPRLKPPLMNISIAHSRDFVGIIMSRFYQAGIDIEYPEEKIIRLAHRFLNQQEIEEMDDKQDIQKLTVCWCIKEAVYKIFGNLKCGFKSVYIHPFQVEKQGTIIASVQNGWDRENIVCKYLTMNNFKIVWTCH